MSLLLTTSCGQPNVLTEYSNTESDAAYHLDAKTKIDNFEWDAAIEILTTKISADYQARNDVKTTLMYAYGGKCGISFFDLIDSLKNVSSTKMFEFVLQLYANRVVDVASCDNAISVLQGIGAAPAQRTSQQNAFAAILGLTRMATTLHAKFDTESSGLGDGLVDAGADSCAIADTAGRLSDADMNRIITGLGLVFENLSELGEQISGGSAGDAFASAKTLCETAIPTLDKTTPQTLIPSIPGGVTWASLGHADPPTWFQLGLPSDVADPVNCLNTDTTAVSDKMRRIFRRMIASTTMGVGMASSCDIADIKFAMDAQSPPKVAVTIACCPGLDSP
ncbi:MAG: hypothetical protein OM95_04345 [Bdellovibrio sp. ArHS]|uniref:hypothetical protein n=1 Tax=Bdellovibrio sp. ArHS TaxID=1569284 RepID=UPI0005833F88|nr:hypothetical protein [Bdellovibrio sp. ArHS]KHD89275.1 MAG: hypothetical protein OM95_04345 [Bdellovibrio sp. ArHS]